MFQLGMCELKAGFYPVYKFIVPYQTSCLSIFKHYKSIYRAQSCNLDEKWTDLKK